MTRSERRHHARRLKAKRRRASDRELIYKVVSGSDPDGIAWSPDNYPTIYYW